MPNVIALTPCFLDFVGSMALNNLEELDGYDLIFIVSIIRQRFCRGLLALSKLMLNCIVPT